MSKVKEKLILSIGSINLDFYSLDRPDYCFLGGSSLNTAYFLQNLLENKNYKVIPIGLIGNDEIGKKIINKMKNKNLETSYIKIIEGNSGKTTIYLDTSGERTIKRENSVNTILHEYVKELISPFIDKTPIIHLKTDLKATKKIIESTDVIFSADISGFLKNGKEKFEDKQLKEIFHNKSIKILLGNLQEFIELTEVLQPNIIKRKDQNLEDFKDYFNFLKEIFHSEYIFIKEGAKGASLFLENKMIHLNAPKVNVIDSTGAGDAFNAGVIYGFLSNINNPLEILEIAIETGSMNCTTLGGQEFCDFDSLRKKINEIRKKYGDLV